MVLAVLLIIVAALHFAFPQATHAGIEQAGKLGNRIFEAIAGEATPDKISASSSRQAHFTNLEGVVKVKKANSNSWRTADYSLPLEKGDVIQTTSEGMAKVVFNDGTNYTVKQDSLIVIEENAANDKQQTSVAVTVSTGTVDLATGTYVQGSSSKVNIAGATASFAPDSAAMVQNDPKADKHEILVKKGSGDIVRGTQTVHLADFEKVSFQKDSTKMPKGKDTVAMSLELSPFVQHGHVIEVTGKTEIGARVMVNGREVPFIGSDGSFHYFTPPLPLGESLITVTTQNARGGVNTQQKTVVIQ